MAQEMNPLIESPSYPHLICCALSADRDSKPLVELISSIYDQKNDGQVL